MAQPLIWAFLVGLGGATAISLIMRFLFNAEGSRRLTPNFVFVAIVLAPAIEELMFRGPVWAITRGEFSFVGWSAIAISAVIFGLMHGIVSKLEDYDEEPNAAGIIRNVIEATLAGGVLGWLTVTTNSLIPAMIVHALYNLSMLCIQAVTQSLKDAA